MENGIRRNWVFSQVSFWNRISSFYSTSCPQQSSDEEDSDEEADDVLAANTVANKYQTESSPGGSNSAEGNHNAEDEQESEGEHKAPSPGGVSEASQKSQAELEIEYAQKQQRKQSRVKTDKAIWWIILFKMPMVEDIIPYRT